MTTTAYIQPSEYAAYGISSATADQVEQASRLIDTWCNRARSGFVWIPDGNGQPCYMASAPAVGPSLTYNGSIAAGLNITVQVQTTMLSVTLIGAPLVLDLASDTLREACVVTAVNQPTNGCITLGQVQFPHTGPVTMVGGLQVFEERYLAPQRSITRVSQWPVVNLLSGMGRFAYGRRSQQVAGYFADYALVATGMTYGGPALWQPFAVSQTDINAITGEMWIPASMLLAYYTEVRLWYCAGWAQAALPTPIKQACARVVNNIIQLAGTPMVNGAIKKLAAGDTTIERFKDVAIDVASQTMLQPFQATQLF